MRNPAALLASALLAGSIAVAHAQQKTNAARSFNKAIYGDDSHGWFCHSEFQTALKVYFISSDSLLPGVITQ
jgi:hypothetical protein